MTKTNVKKYFINSVFIFSLFVAFSRGIFELYVGKQISYIVQLLTWLIFIISLFATSKKIKCGKYIKKGSIAFAIFFIAIFTSCFLTINLSGFDGFWLYIAVNIFFITLFLISTMFDFKINLLIKYDKIISIMALILFIFSLLQQSSIITFLPGNTLIDNKIRPSSLTGSYLHYPLIMSLTFFVMIEKFNVSKEKFYLLMTIISFLSVFISLSRSGSMIIILGVIIYLFIRMFNYGRKNIRINIIIFMIFSVILIAALLIVLIFNQNIYINRILSSLNFNSPGNPGRITAWRNGLNLWIKSDIFFGSQTGLITNISKNFNVTNSTVVESSFIQQLLNFGLVGTLSFYYIWYIVILKINKKHLWLKSGLLAALLESFVYQSIEVFPFMVFISLYPFISYNIRSGKYE